MISKKLGVLLLITIALVLIGVGLHIPPMSQPSSYHEFADNRTWLGIHNAWNVLSNLFFAFTGLIGLYLLLTPNKCVFFESYERGIWIVFSLSLILVALGSGYYHLAPDNARLVWDRLPMTFVFMSVLAALISDRIYGPLGFCLWPFLLALGIYSVLVWYASELQGTGDLRIYAALQGYTAIAVLILCLMPSHYDRSFDIALAVLCYCFAKVFETFDSEIFQLTHNFISGHTLKHLAAALTGALLIRMIWKRRITP